MRRQGFTPVIQTPWGWLWCGQPLVHMQRCWLAEGPLPALLRPSPDRLLPPPPLLLLLLLLPSPTPHLLLLIPPPHQRPLLPPLLPLPRLTQDGLVGSKNEQYLHLDCDKYIINTQAQQIHNTVLCHSNVLCLVRKLLAFEHQQ